jgi:hypothetical protein
VRPLAAALALAPAALVLAACGADEDGAPREPSPATSLSVSFWPQGEGEPTEWTLACGPAGGTHPDAAEACALLDGLAADAFAPVPPDSICTQVYGGPQRARVRGEWRGEAVDAELSRENGCEIARWDRLVPLLPAAAA